MRLVRMLGEFEDTALADCGFELDVCTLIAEYEVDARGPEMLRDKIFKIDDDHGHFSSPLIGLRLNPDSRTLCEVPRDEMPQYFGAPTKDGSRVFQLHVGRSDQSFNIKMILVTLPIKHAETRTCASFIWDETIESFWGMFVNNMHDNGSINIGDDQSINQSDLVDILSNTAQGQRMLYSLVADDAAELARFRMAAGRIQMRQCDIPNVAEAPDDIDMFITREELDTKNKSRLREFQKLFPYGVVQIIAEYANDQTHVASEMITLSSGVSGQGSLTYISVPDPDDSTMHWSLMISDYTPVSMICRGMRNNPYCAWGKVWINTCDFVSGRESDKLVDDIVEARTVCVNPRGLPALIWFDPNLITVIIDRLRDAVRVAVNQKMNRDMRQIAPMLTKSATSSVSLT